MGRVLGSLSTVVGGGLVLLVVLLVNGGYVYKTTCPLPSGGSESHWTYGIDDLLPYIRSTSPPCESHTGTRLLISAIGISPLHGSSARVGPSAEDKDAAASLRNATEAITREFARERRYGAKLKAVLPYFDAEGRRQLVTNFVHNGNQELRYIQARLNRKIDDDLVEARRLLATWLGLQVKVNKAVLGSARGAEMKAKAEAIARDEIAPVARRLETLSYRIEAKYPQVTSWSFLPAR